jgi:tetratricopeptide (TPR) repeat protein
MSNAKLVSIERCPRCNASCAPNHRFCAECGVQLCDNLLERRLLAAMAYEREGRNNEARQELERILECDPAHAIANHLLGTLYFHEGVLEFATHYYNQAIAAAPRFILAHYDLGVAWYHRGNMLEAIRAFRRCLEIDPHYNAAHYRLALSLFHAGR